MDNFTLAVTKKHLDKAIKAYKNPVNLLSKSCAIIQAFKEKFPQNGEEIAMGMEMFCLGEKVTHTCKEARRITEFPMTEPNRQKLEKLLPMELEFVKV